MAREKKTKKLERLEEIAYKCQSCGYVVYQKATEAAPEFCPNCAITHLKGIMVKVTHV